jgi:putative FmdB family regulatory protein
MPTYEYECTQCGEIIELFQSIKDRPKRFLAVECSECDNRAPVVRRIGAGGGLIFKGSGFYSTDYRGESYRKAAAADQPASSDSKAGKDGETAKPKKPKADPPADRPKTSATPSE